MTQTTSPKVFLITGSSSGFGASIARIALSRGHKVIATARNPSKLTSLKNLGASILTLDVTSPLSSLQSTIKEAHAIHSRIDILINAAGYILDGALEEATEKETYDEFNTNVFGTINVCRAVIPYLRAQKSGVIANFGSLGSWIGGAGYSLYSSVKWAVSGLSESLRPELEPFGITVTVIEPGYFRSNFLAPDARVTTKAKIQEYDETAVGEVQRILTKVGGNQPGDVEKGCTVIVDVLTREGEKKGKEIPLRLCLGTDVNKAIREKCRSTVALLEEWKDICESTDY